MWRSRIDGVSPTPGGNELTKPVTSSTESELPMPTSLSRLTAESETRELTQKYAALLKPAEAASFLLTSVGTLAQWRYLRRGPAYIKVGRSVAYRLGDLLDYVEQTRVSHNGVAA